ncbi:MAG TPA: nucleotide exchange factor GrpE [Rhizomicrobium sp.]|jgi:molecular chaperone GrpE|nr:nucleotide exchange factor GrpE [Rhizomicrobium sp.]
MADNDNEIEAGDGAGQTEASGELDEATALRSEVAELKERLLRALAETENTRRRAERDKTDASQYAVTRFARDLLHVSDNLRRALSHLSPDVQAEAASGVKAVLDGVEATERELTATLERHGIRAIEAEGARFDPNLHQAIAEVPADGKAAGSVVSVVQTGYVIADRLLRPAMVTVAKASNAGSPTFPDRSDNNGS